MTDDLTDGQLDRLLRAADPAVALLDRPAPDDVLDDILAGRRTGPHDDDLATALDALDRAEAPRGSVVSLRRRRMVALLAAALATGVVGFLLVTSREADPVDLVACHVGPSTQADATIVRAAGLEAAVDACRELWEAGDMVEAVPGTEPVPPLVPCVLDSGAIGVFPATSCEDVARPEPGRPGQSPGAGAGSGEPGSSEVPDIGLPLPDLVPDDAGVAEVIETLRVTLLETCLPADEAETVVRTVLDTAGMADWTVQVVGTHSEGDCVAFAPDLAEQRIDLPPVAR